MKNEVFKPRKISKALLCFITGCLLLAFYASYETGQWAIPLPLLPPVFIILAQHRTRYLIWEDGRVEIRFGWGKSKILNELHQVIYYPKNWLNNRIRIHYQNTFELLNPERPQEFLEALRRYAPGLKIKEK